MQFNDSRRPRNLDPLLPEAPVNPLPEFVSHPKLRHELRHLDAYRESESRIRKPWIELHVRGGLRHHPGDIGNRPPRDIQQNRLHAIHIFPVADRYLDIRSHPFLRKEEVGHNGLGQLGVRDQDHIVNLTINVDRGPQFTLGKLDIQGLDLIGEPAVRKMWKIEPGQPYQDGYPEAFLNRVRDEGIFDNLGKTRAETNIHEDSHTVDVTLFFAGAGAPAKDKAGKRR